jgi:phospho-2-dehydro-3-deoxyheptonate aldolase
MVFRHSVHQPQHPAESGFSYTLPADRRQLRYGVSVTDACVGWETTERMLRHAYAQMGEDL